MEGGSIEMAYIDKNEETPQIENKGIVQPIIEKNEKTIKKKKVI